MNTVSNIKRMCLMLIALSLGLTGLASAGEYFVSAKGDDTNPGTLDRPFRTVAKAASVMKAGDTCYIRKGTYHQEVVSSGTLKGTSDSPITFAPYKGEKVVFDGTKPITGKWTRYKDSIYMTTVSEDIWQLCVDGEMMIMARWPNVDPETLWQQDRKKYWAQGKVELDTLESMTDDPQGEIDLAGSGLDATGAMAILNNGSFTTWTRKVTEHKAGSATFSHEPTPKKAYRKKHHYYYLECTLNLLDAEKEWYYDASTKTLYLWAPGGGIPEGDIRGKTQSYAFDITGAQHVTIRGIEFFATTFRWTASTHITIEDCDLSYPSCSKRMLGETGVPDASLIDQPGNTSPSSCVVRNCTFENTDGHGLYVRGADNRVENCAFRNIDFSVSSLPRLMISVYMDGVNGVFRRNTIHTCGASSTVKPGRNAVVELNRIWDTGYLQSDGAMIHCTKPEQPGVQIRYNWCHDSVKYGARFDGQPGSTNGTMRHNVIWRVGGGFMVKGDHHFIYSNTGFENLPKNDIMALSDEKYGGNANTIFRNNMVNKIAGHRVRPVSQSPVPGIYDHNWNGLETGSDVRTQLRDPYNLDFRPKAGSDIIDAGVSVPGVTDGFIGKAPDIGAYEYGDSHYWIPGRKEKKASTPIPPDGTQNAQLDADLMWLEGYRADAHDVYFGTDRKKVECAHHDSPEFKGTQKNNIFDPGELRKGAIYYWRIDMVRGLEIFKGDVWGFIADPEKVVDSDMKELLRQRVDDGID